MESVGAAQSTGSRRSIAVTNPGICLLTKGEVGGFLIERCVFSHEIAAEFHPVTPMNIASLFNLAGPDVVIILAVVMVLFGAKKLPELAKGLGQSVREFTKAKDEFQKEVSRPTLPES